ncbi:MAG: hypothetical protein KatS3mg092_0874 [Patescibacteria group bacterium]|nr:MAG: hypothetical protein KatS3mg092_0874 [Patescibacteria group bacterium]
MLKVYFTASTFFNGQFKENYKKIIQLLKKHWLILTSGEQIVNQKLLEEDKKLTPQEIFKRQKTLIDKSDFVVAEVTKPSHGVGGEIVYALVNEKPVLALVYENNQDLISPMILGNPSDNFYLERYDLDKLSFIISDFVKFIKTKKNKKGKLIVIDGGDGSGKTVQSQLLIDYLKKENKLVKYFDFPQYYKTFHGRTVAKFLQGEFGKIDEVSPYLASLAYALDRLSVKQEMDYFLKKGGLIICNRYATSSLAHQGAKFKDEKKKKEFLKWLYDLEYKIHKIPKEDIVIYLYVPWQIGMELTNKKGLRDYLQGKKDIAESDINHRIASEKMYLELASINKNWVKIDCVENNKLLPPEVIHKKIIEVLKQKRII